MGRGQELTPQLRSRICELKRVGFGPAKIHKLHPEVSINTIKSTLRREADRDDNVSQKRSGRPRQLTEEDRDYIYDLVKHKKPDITRRELLAAIDNKIKNRTLGYLLREMGIRLDSKSAEGSDTHIQHT